ncbi:riboflavin synthase [Rhizomicrobium palustre]|uniref:Riboflavin synthase n=1 Tax=Rhizomicrobium palustre TaxID=189966 RepID=A0A846N2N8_9PROT|nr:riboflavin synthase [Rhizomicrobium palustre]NIK89779.1 riboflavin synthase [Rhizomicrobium palustre]
MFTGIVTDVGEVRQIEKRGDTHIVIATHYTMDKLPMGGSVACAGTCLTVVERGPDSDPWFAVTASAETLSKTVIGTWKTGTKVNLELPLKVGDELGGHIVSGHVDGLAELVEMHTEGESTRMLFEVPKPLAKFIAEKGSVALDGVSLTVNEVDGNRFGINVIPHTQEVTTFGQLKPGMKVNLEIDTIARYVARLVKG